MPDYDDYTGAVRAIHRLEDTYLLKTKDIQKGKLSTQYPSRPLTGIFHIHSSEMCHISYIIF